MAYRADVVSIEDLAARLDRVESELALRRLAANYCVGADQEDLARFTAIWTHDALWDAAGEDAEDQEHRFAGIEAITAAVRGQWETFPRMQHATSNHVVELDEDDADRASGRCDVVSIVQLPDGRWSIGGGVYEDSYRREGGTWRIALRQVLRAFDLQPLPASHGTTHAEKPEVG